MLIKAIGRYMVVDVSGQVYTIMGNVFSKIYQIRPTFYLLVLSFLIGIVRPAYGQNVNFQTLKVANDSLDSPVTAIAQDASGFMWFASGSDIHRYDGYRLSSYSLWQAQGGESDGIWSLLLSQDGTLWAATARGLWRYDKAQDLFVSLELGFDKLVHINAITESEPGFLWLATHNGLIRYSVKDGHSKRFVELPAEQESKALWSVFYSQDKTLWVGSNNGLLQFDLVTCRFSAVFKGEPILAINEDSSGRLWFGSNNGVKRLAKTQQISDWQALEFAVVTAIWRDRSGYLWLGTLQGLYRIDLHALMTEQFATYTDKPVNSVGEAIFAVFQDARGLMWAGTSSGVERTRSVLLPGKAYSNQIVKQGGKIPIGISSIHVTGDRVWLGENGLSWFDTQKQTFSQRQAFENNSKLPAGSLNAIDSDRQGFLWVGTQEGLNRIDLKTHQVTRYNHIPGDEHSIVSSEILSLRATSKGQLWIGTEHGLSRFNYADETFVNYRYQRDSRNGLSHPRVMAINEDSEGVLWLGTGRGINRLDTQTGQFELFRIDESDTNWFGVNVILSGHYDEQLGLWFGTNGGGLAHYDKASGKFHHYQKADGISSQTIVGITSSGGYIWLATSKGIDRFDPASKTFDNFTIARLQQRGWILPRAIAATDSGKLYFGGYGFFQVIDSKRIAYPSNIPKLALLDIDYKAAGKPLRKSLKQQLLATEDGQSHSITVPYRQQRLAFQFALLDFASPDLTQYRYQLKGFDKDWTTVAADGRFAQYHALAPGRYQFHLKAKSHLGTWWDNEQVVNVYVEYPVWRRWWAYVLYALCLGVLLSVVYRKVTIVQAQKAIEEQPNETGKRVEQEKSIQPISEKDRLFVEKVEQVIATHYTDPSFNVIKLSSELAMSERQLRRKLKALCDYGPTEYLRRYRLKVARDLLLTGERVNVVADAVGFASSTYMSNCFKTQYGMSPGQYQKTHRPHAGD